MNNPIELTSVRWLAVAVTVGLGVAAAAQAQTNAGSGSVVAPYGIIDGTVRHGSKAGTNEVVRLTGDPGGMWEGRYHPPTELFSTTDSDGRFVFHDVRPGKQEVVRVISRGNNNWYGASSATVEVKAGEVAHVTLGGTGRRIIGKLAIDPPREPLQCSNSIICIDAHLDRHMFIGEFGPGGSFRIDDVPAGSNVLSLGIFELVDGPRPSMFDAAAFNQVVIVPVMPTGWSDEPLDLGSIEVHTHSALGKE